MGKFFTAITAVCFLLVVVLGGYYVGFLRIPVLEKGLSDLEAECVAAAITSDARYPGEVDKAVFRRVGLSVLNHAKKYNRDVCDVFRLGLTLVPPGYNRFKYYFRSEKYVYWIEATKASWLSDVQLAHELRKEVGKDPSTHLKRKDRKSDRIAQPLEAVTFMKTKMKSTGRAKQDGVEVGTAEFFHE